MALALGFLQVVGILIQEHIHPGFFGGCMILQPLLCLPFGVSFAAPASEGAGEGLTDAVVLYVDLPAAPALNPCGLIFSF